jgi:hypothetical protein
MRKKAVCVTTVLVCATLAYAEANKIRGFTPVNGENATADGMAILHYNAGQGETNVMIILSNFQPNTRYDFELVSPSSGSAISLDLLVTDEEGNAHYKADFAGNLSDADILIYLSEDPEFSEDELRAVGTQAAQ